MKKSLVALAALTLVGAASAQVTITGNFSGSYQKSLDGTRGLAVSDNSIFFGVTEDLGGGNKLTASAGFDAGGRNKDFAAQTGSENFSIKVGGGWGSLNFASYESDGPFANVAISGASLPVGVFDAAGANLGKRAREAVTYSTPSFSGFTGALTYVTAAGQFSSTPGTATNPSLGASAWDSNTKVVPALTYQSGPLKAYVEYALFNQSYNNNADDTVTQPTAYVSYDFGVAKVAAGWTKPSNRDVTVGLGVNVPVGAFTFGVETFSYNNNNAAVGTAGTATYSDIAIAYSLSKRTTLKASFGTVNDAFVAYSKANPYGQTQLTPTGADSSTSQSRIGLFHSF